MCQDWCGHNLVRARFLLLSGRFVHVPRHEHVGHTPLGLRICKLTTDWVPRTVSGNHRHQHDASLQTTSLRFDLAAGGGGAWVAESPLRFGSSRPSVSTPAGGIAGKCHPHKSWHAIILQGAAAEKQKAQEGQSAAAGKRGVHLQVGFRVRAAGGDRT